MEDYFKPKQKNKPAPKAFPNADFYALRVIIIDICVFAIQEKPSISSEFTDRIDKYANNDLFVQTETDVPLTDHEIDILIRSLELSVMLLRSSKQSSLGKLTKHRLELAERSSLREGSSYHSAQSRQRRHTHGGKKRTRRALRHRRRQRRTKKFIKRSSYYD
jgi:hypothetical protein